MLVILCNFILLLGSLKIYILPVVAEYKCADGRDFGIHI